MVLFSGPFFSAVRAAPAAKRKGPILFQGCREGENPLSRTNFAPGLHCAAARSCGVLFCLFQLKYQLYPGKVANISVFSKVQTPYFCQICTKPCCVQVAQLFVASLDISAKGHKQPSTAQQDMRVFGRKSTICVFLFAQFFAIIIVYKGGSGKAPLGVLCFSI